MIRLKGMCKRHCIMIFTAILFYIMFSIRVEASIATNISKECIYMMEECYGAKKTEDGFYYTMDSKAIVDGFESYYRLGGISKDLYKKYSARYKNKKNCCYLLSYMGNKKNICLPKEIEGVSNYVLCISDLDGMNSQVKKVTIPDNVTISSVLFDNPLICLGSGCKYNDNHYFEYKFDVEKGNSFLKSIHGMLCSKDGKTVYGIPSSTKGKLVIPDSATEVHLSFIL